ncbi:unnamed protein product [Rotaria sp. Silwood1]|nr:unnamed protein product [Rotaria sp. Silwood1]CAF4974177.1 unnamed protein product [Rotaria sp. Silwood1]
MSLSEKKTWLCLRLNTLSCSLSEECIIFNVTCYSNGYIIFHGINNTAYLGKKTFQLEKNRMIALNEFIQTHAFISDFQSIKILLRIELFHHNNNEIYFWRNDTISYTLLISLLNINTLSSYKHWSILLRTAHILSNIQQRNKPKHFIDINSKLIQTRQKFQQSLKYQNSIRSIRTKRMIIPIAKISYSTDDNNDIFPYNIEFIMPSIQKLRLITEKFNDDICFSSKVIESQFDLIDACLSTNDIIGDNQFYTLRNLFNWFSNQTKWSNALINLQETTTFESISYTTTTSTSVTEQTTLSHDEILAENAVNNVVNNRSELIGLNDSRITTAQALVDNLPLSSPIKATLQQKLNNIKASLTQTTVSFNVTSESATTISSANTTFRTTLGLSNETLQTTVTASSETFYSTPIRSNETVQATVSAADTTLVTTLTTPHGTLHTLVSTSGESNATVQTTVSPSNETLQATISTSGEILHSTPSGSNETVQTTISAANTTFFTTVSTSNRTLQATVSTSGEMFHSTISASNETVQTTVRAADTTHSTTVSTLGETFHSTFGGSNETVQTTVSAPNTTLLTTVGPSNGTLGTTTGNYIRRYTDLFNIASLGY